MNIKKIDVVNLSHRENRNDCPECGAKMLLLTSQNKKICVDCCKEFSWTLETNQKPLIQAQR